MKIVATDTLLMKQEAEEAEGYILRHLRNRQVLNETLEGCPAGLILPQSRGLKALEHILNHGSGECP